MIIPTNRHSSVGWNPVKVQNLVIGLLSTTYQFIAAWFFHLFYYCCIGYHDACLDSSLRWNGEGLVVFLLK